MFTRLLFYAISAFVMQLHIRILKGHRMRMIQITQLCVLLCNMDYFAFFPCIFVTNFFELQIFVGNLDPNVTDDHLRRVFGQYGELVHVKIPAGKRCGFVQFADR